VPQVTSKTLVPNTVSDIDRSRLKSRFVPKPTLAHLIKHLVGKREQQTPFVSMKIADAI